MGKTLIQILDRSPVLGTQMSTDGTKYRGLMMVKPYLDGFLTGCLENLKKFLDSKKLI